MRYGRIWSKVLSKDEKIKYEFSVGDLYRYVGWILLSILGLGVAIHLWWLGVVLIFLAWFYFGFYLKTANAFAFTNRRVLIYRGWLSTEMISVDYDKITDISVIEPIIERLITKTGHLTINTAGTEKAEIVLKHITHPYEVKKKLDMLRK